MGLVELSVIVRSVQKGLVPEARAWVDLDPEGDLRSEIELPLHRQKHWRWVGVMGFAEPSADSFFYRLGIVAHEGAEWALKVRDRVTGRDILVDTDMMTSPKCWLIGSCGLRTLSQHSPRGAIAERGSACNLVLLARPHPK